MHSTYRKLQKRKVSSSCLKHCEAFEVLKRKQSSTPRSDASPLKGMVGYITVYYKDFICCLLNVPNWPHGTLIRPLHTACTLLTWLYFLLAFSHKTQRPWSKGQTNWGAGSRLLPRVSVSGSNALGQSVTESICWHTAGNFFPGYSKLPEGKEKSKA